MIEQLPEQLAALRTCRWYACQGLLVTVVLAKPASFCETWELNLCTRGFSRILRLNPWVRGFGR